MNSFDLKSTISNKTELYKDINLIKQNIMESCITISNLLRNYNTINKKNINIVNKSGDDVCEIDDISNEIIKENLRKLDIVYAISSEEEEDIVYLNNFGKYFVVFDPLDGSKNIDCNLSTGSIFGVFEINNKKIEDLTGNDMVYASYALYSSATLYLNSSVLDVTKLYLLSNNSFSLIDNDVKIPNKGKYYYINHSNINYMYNSDKYLLEQLILNGKSNRWTGCMVSDVHRLISYGGLFSYSDSEKHLNGRLRLVYEVLPMSFIVENSYGKSYTNYKSKISALNNKIGNDIHKKTPIYLCGKIESNL